MQWRNISPSKQRYPYQQVAATVLAILRTPRDFFMEKLKLKSKNTRRGRDRVITINAIM